MSTPTAAGTTVWFETADVATPTGGASVSSAQKSGALIVDLAGVKTSPPTEGSSASLPVLLLGGLQGQVAGQVANQLATSLINSGQNRAQGVMKRLQDYDSFRPYFDISPGDLWKRLRYALFPSPLHEIEGPVDLYGPLMCVFTLVALLNVRMKLLGVPGRGAFLFGESLALSVTYWLLFTLLMWGVTFACNTQLKFLQVASATGYAMFGYCCSVALFILIPPLWILWWIVLGTVSAARLVCKHHRFAKVRAITYFKKTPRVRDAAIPFFVALPVHLLYLLFLSFRTAP